MNSILSDTSKFQKDEFQIDLNHKIEKQVSSSVAQLLKKGVISKATSKVLTPVGSHTPRLYGLPKTHKEGVPLRPILSMTNTPTHRLAQFLGGVLQPVRDAVSSSSLVQSRTPSILSIV